MLRGRHILTGLLEAVLSLPREAPVKPSTVRPRYPLKASPEVSRALELAAALAPGRSVGVEELWTGLLCLDGEVRALLEERIGYGRARELYRQALARALGEETVRRLEELARERRPEWR